MSLCFLSSTHLYRSLQLHDLPTYQVVNACTFHSRALSLSDGMVIALAPVNPKMMLLNISETVHSVIAHPKIDASTMAANVESVRQNFPLALLLSTIAGASTGLGGILSVQQNLSAQRLGLWQGIAAGFMLSVSFVDLMPAVLEDLAVLPALFYFFLGAMLFLLLKQFIPEPEIEAYCKDDKAARDVYWSGILTAAGISLHNFPEGVAVCVASLRGIKFGLPLAIAIGLHNIPEGMAVALPLYYATRNKVYAMQMAFLSGMAEPAGVLFILAIIHVSGELSQSAVAKGLSAVAGIMVVLSLLELIPQAVKHAGNRAAILGSLSGLFVMTAMLRLLDYLGLSV